VLLLQRCGGAPRLHCGQNPGAAVHGGQAWPGLNRRYDSVSEQHALSLTSRLETYYESSNVSTRVTGDALGVCIPTFCSCWALDGLVASSGLVSAIMNFFQHE